MVVVLLSSLAGNLFAFEPGTLLDVSDKQAEALIASGNAQLTEGPVDPTKVKTIPKPRPVAPSVVDATVDAGNIETEEFDTDVVLADLVDYGLEPKVQAKLIDGVAKLPEAERPKTATELIEWSANNGGMAKLSGVGDTSVRSIEAVLRSLGLIE
ncbi:hypothetical protein [Rosistilla oblonga]|uniref:hypothetical protein n=1 Tax=Rosistilla oblonga TaxID=2527990 RepID=UPI003A97ECA2